MKLQKLVSALLHIVSIQQQGTSLQIQQLLPEGLRNIFLVVKGQLSHKANSNRCSAPSLPVTPSIRPGSPPHFLPSAPVVLWHDKPASGGPCLGSQGHYPRSPILHFCSYPLPCPRALHFTTLLGEASFSPSVEATCDSCVEDIICPWLLSQNLQCCSHWDQPGAFCWCSHYVHDSLRDVWSHFCKILSATSNVQLNSFYNLFQ